MSENNGKVLRDTDGEIVGFWIKPPDHAVDDVTPPEQREYERWHEESPQFTEDMEINFFPSEIKTGLDYHFYIGDRELDCDKAWEWIQEAIYEKAEREKLVKKCSLCKQADGNGEKRYYCMSHGDFVGGDECCSRFQPEDDE